MKSNPHSNVCGRLYHVSWLKVTVKLLETFLYTMLVNASVIIK